MKSIKPNPGQHERFHIPLAMAFCMFLAIAIFFLWEEHRAHLLGMLPWALFLLCPLVHLFMHRGHGHNHGQDTGRAPDHRNPGNGGHL